VASLASELVSRRDSEIGEALRRLRLGLEVHADFSASAFGNDSKPLSAAVLANVVGAQLPELQSLDLSGNDLGSKENGEGAPAVRALSGSPSLTSLTLSDNALGPGALKSLSSALRVNVVLRHLDLRNNDLTASGSDESGVRMLAHTLTFNAAPNAVAGRNFNATLLSLDLSGNHLGENDVRHFGECLQAGGCPLVQLVLASCSVGAAAAQELVRSIEHGLRTPHRLRLSVLDLADNACAKADLRRVETLLAKSFNLRRALERRARGYNRCSTRFVAITPWRDLGFLYDEEHPLPSNRPSKPLKTDPKPAFEDDDDD